MKTAVIMKRELLGDFVSQHSKTEMLSLTDLNKTGNKWRIANGLDLFNHKTWLQNKGTKEFIAELEQRYGKGNVLKSGRGRGNHTWAHPLLFIDMALSISPKIKIEVYEWLFDHLIRERNNSGASYNLMCGALYKRNTNYTKFPAFIADVAKKIKLACNVEDWQTATEAQLKKRDAIHNNIALLADVLQNNSEAVRIAILKSTEI